MKMPFGKSKKESPSGKFIVIDGTDGSGKTTQAELLIKELELSGYNVETLVFPQYGSKSAGVVEEYLQGKYGQMNPQAASLLYAVDRFDASFKIRKLLSQGKIIVCQRYVTSNAGHQGGNIKDDVERVKFFRWLDNIEYGIFNIPKPDLNLILHVPAEIAFKLVGARAKKQKIKNDLLEKDLKHLQRAEKVYLEIAKLFPNTKLVECVSKGKLLSPSDIHNKVWDLVRRIALKNNK
ncbi:MAG TPA: dTMP kinase [Candidatus Limnocylindria bacterium]|nr:dTMP kinase [Candidatus Limnocylindria bacterium]